jgi:hypothetical protein
VPSQTAAAKVRSASDAKRTRLQRSRHEENLSRGASADTAYPGDHDGMSCVKPFDRRRTSAAQVVPNRGRAPCRGKNDARMNWTAAAAYHQAVGETRANGHLRRDDIANMLAPLPRCATTTLPSAAGAKVSWQFARDAISLRLLELLLRTGHVVFPCCIAAIGERHGRVHAIRGSH